MTPHGTPLERARPRQAIAATPRPAGLPTDRRILAVDGGGSTIRVATSDRAGAIERAGVRRDADHDARVVASIESAWQELGRPEIDRAVLGLTTAPADPDRARALAAVIGGALDANEVWISDDAVTSHVGALSGGWGVSLTCGTGVACLVMPKHGAPAIVGGHGYMLGDEGGAFWLGREGLRAALRAGEGRAAPTDLGRLAAERFGPLDQLSVRLHDDAGSVDAIARFAKDVLDAVERDEVAARIVDDAATELHDLAVSAAHQARGPAGSTTVPLGLGGRLLADANPLRRSLDARLARDTGIEPRTADGSPLDGALALGSQETPGRYGSLVHTWSAGPR